MFLWSSLYDLVIFHLMLVHLELWAKIFSWMLFGVGYKQRAIFNGLLMWIPQTHLSDLAGHVASLTSTPLQRFHMAMVYVSRTSMPMGSRNSEFIYLTPEKLHSSVKKNSSPRKMNQRENSIWEMKSQVLQLQWDYQKTLPWRKAAVDTEY